MAPNHPGAAEAARLAAHIKWASCPDRAAARQAFAQRWEKLVDPDGALPAGERAQRAADAKRAHYAELAVKSAEVRRAKAAAQKAANDAA